MISLLTSWGLGARAAKLVAYVGLPMLVLIAFYFVLSAYGNARYREGVAAENASWRLAQDALLKRAAESAGKASSEDLARQAEFAAKVEDEKEKLDAAVADGSSPFDVLFPASD
jgi:hypothetical protein